MADFVYLHHPQLRPVTTSQATPDNTQNKLDKHGEIVPSIEADNFRKRLNMSVDSVSDENDTLMLPAESDSEEERAGPAPKPPKPQKAVRPIDKRAFEQMLKEVGLDLSTSEDESDDTQEMVCFTLLFKITFF